MAPRYTRRKINGYIWCARALAVAIVLFPLSLSHLDFRAAFSRGLSVAAYKSSPAYAAFEDIHEAYTSDVFEMPDRGSVVTLAAGQRFNSKLIESLPRQRQIALRGLVIRQPPTEPDSTPVMLASGGSIMKPMAPDPRMLIPHRQLYADDTPSAEPSITSVSARAQELVAQELARSGRGPAAMPSRRIIQSTTGTQILVARGDEPLPPPSVPPTVDQTYSFAAVSPANENQRPLWLNGQIEMTGGLAFVGPETQLVVKRVYNGETYEKGRIWVTEGKFEIHVKRASGFLVAELFTREGQVLGRGEIDLVNIVSAARNENHIDDLRIALRPTTQTAAQHVISGYSNGNQVLAAAGAKVQIQAFNDPQPVNEDGTVSEPTLVKDSSFVARATAPKNWATLVVGQAGQSQDIRVFSDSMLEALISLTLNGTDRAEAYHLGVVWGQITHNGQPVEGATVEMAGDYQPIYFNAAYIPDRSLTSTGKNGLFAILKVRAGVQALRVKSGGRTYPAQIFPSEERHVSYLEMELRDKIVSQFKVIDVLDMSRPVSARIKLVGADAALNMVADEYVEYGVAGNTFMIEAEAGPEFERSRTTLNGTPQLVHVPMIRKDWLRALAQERGINFSPGRGVVVGFVDDQDFRVEITGVVAQGSTQIVYFDGSGKYVPGDSGVAGGGFAILNAPPGLQTVYIHTTQSTETFSQVVVAEPEYVHVMTWSVGRL